MISKIVILIVITIIFLNICIVLRRLRNKSINYIKWLKVMPNEYYNDSLKNMIRDIKYYCNMELFLYIIYTNILYLLILRHFI